MIYDTVVIGAGAAGLFCAGFCPGRVLVVDHAKAPGEKIRISGGGRCNFTNLYCGPENFLGENPHFCKSALARYSQWDFIDLIARAGIAYHEKTLGQLFCDGKATQVIDLLLGRMGADLRLRTQVLAIEQGDGFRVHLDPGGWVTARNLVIATGGKSIPKIGASGFGYDIARQFGHRVTETRAGLVPLTFTSEQLAWMKPLAGLSCPARVTAGGTGFEEGLLFTHRGLSGPSVLQASNYWREGAAITVDADPQGQIMGRLRQARKTQGKRGIATVIAQAMPDRLAQHFAAAAGVTGRIGDLSDAQLAQIETSLRALRLVPVGTEGYRTAEVTLGGVATDQISSKTMESALVPGLYFIGEVLDVTGWLGGYNFQWAWSSAHAAGMAIAGQTRDGAG